MDEVVGVAGTETADEAAGKAAGGGGGDSGGIVVRNLFRQRIFHGLVCILKFAEF